MSRRVCPIHRLLLFLFAPGWIARNSKSVEDILSRCQKVAGGGKRRIWAVAKHHEFITEDLATFIAAQPMFFVATAADQGRINLSPKGLDGTLTVLGPRRVAFLNLTGSGNETAAHLSENDRITLMFCSFGPKPIVLRLYGSGRAIHPRDAEWDDLDRLFAPLPGKRQIILIDVTSVITSCGFGVPLMELAGQRETLVEWAEAKGDEGIRTYWRERNAASFDDLPTGIL